MLMLAGGPEEKVALRATSSHQVGATADTGEILSPSKDQDVRDCLLRLQLNQSHTKLRKKPLTLSGATRIPPTEDTWHELGLDGPRPCQAQSSGMALQPE